MLYSSVAIYVRKGAFYLYGSEQSTNWISTAKKFIAAILNLIR